MRKCIAGRLCPADGYEEVYCSRGMPDGSVRRTVMRKCIAGRLCPADGYEEVYFRTALSGGRLRGSVL